MVANANFNPIELCSMLKRLSPTSHVLAMTSFQGCINELGQFSVGLLAIADSDGRYAVSCISEAESDGGQRAKQACKSKHLIPWICIPKLDAYISGC